MASYDRNNLPDELKTYRIRQRVKAYKLTESSTASTPFGALAGNPGDYLVVSDDGNVGIIPAAEFSRLFEDDEDGTATGIYAEPQTKPEDDEEGFSLTSNTD